MNRINYLSISKKISKKMPGYFNAAMAAVLFVTIVLAVRDCFYFASKGFRGHAAVKTSAPGVKPDIAEYSAAVSQNPFGIKNAVFKSLLTGAKGGGLPPSRLKLLGTITGNHDTGYAVIEDENGAQELFKIGDEVFNSGTLARVTPEAVYLSGGGKIDIAEIAAGAHTQPTTAALVREGTGVSSGGAANTFILSQSKVLEALENPKQLMTDARLQPRHKGGKQEGFVLQEIKPGGLYDQLGLKNGDVLLSINRYDITDPETALAAFAALKGAAELHLEILRGPAKLTLNYLVK
ncbi:MAG: PDZ domain-containing protein [Nitrospirae bacterium]|nr:PDZ domain-containing protein [Nitrospirota bacterium]